jgi:hypothetical protein
MNTRKSVDTPQWLIALGVIVGLAAIVGAINLIILGEFTFKGQYYSSVETPVTYWLYVIGLLSLGGISLFLPLLPNSWFENE